MMRGIPREQVEASVERLRHGAQDEAIRELKLFFILQKIANDMNVDGTRWMARALSDPRLPELRRGRLLRVIPIASRVEQFAQVEELGEFRRLFAREFGPFAPPGAGL